MKNGREKRFRPRHRRWCCWGRLAFEKKTLERGGGRVVPMAPVRKRTPAMAATDIFVDGGFVRGGGNSSQFEPRPFSRAGTVPVDDGCSRRCLGSSGDSSGGESHRRRDPGLWSEKRRLGCGASGRRVHLSHAKKGREEDVALRPAATVVALGVAGDVMDQRRASLRWPFWKRHRRRE